MPVKEEWRAVVSFDRFFADVYEVSSFGNVRSLDRITRNWRGPITRKGRLLTLLNHNAGYVCVNLSKDGVKAPGTLVHRLVAEAFLPRIEGRDEINHKDFNKKNNHLTNLEWCNGSENLLHAGQDGRMHRAHFTKLAKEDVRKIRSRLEAGEFHERIARDFNISRTVVTRINSGTRWRSVR